MLLRHGIELLHVPTSYTLPLLAPRLVVTVHDYTLRKFPEFLPNPIGRAYYRLMNAVAIRRARRIIAVSESTRSDILDFWPTAASKTRTVLNGVAALFAPVRDQSILAQVRRALALPERYILYVGTRKRHKNLPRLLEAYAGLTPEQRRRHPLVLVAPPDVRYPEVEATTRRTGITQDVLWRSDVPDQDLPAVYTLARFVVLPSLYEGFGLPVAEAMACGTPAIVARAGSLPEIGGDACLCVDPLDPANICRGLSRLLEDDALRAELAQRAQRRARAFSWDRAASEVTEIYREALA